MVTMFPQIATTKPAPAERRSSLTLILKPVGLPRSFGLSESDRGVFAMHTGNLSKPVFAHKPQIGLSRAVEIKRRLRRRPPAPRYQFCLRWFYRADRGNAGFFFSFFLTLRSTPSARSRAPFPAFLEIVRDDRLDMVFPAEPDDFGQLACRVIAETVYGHDRSRPKSRMFSRCFARLPRPVSCVSRHARRSPWS